MKGAKYGRPAGSSGAEHWRFHKKRRQSPSPERVRRRRMDVEHTSSTRQRDHDRTLLAQSIRPPLAGRIQGGLQKSRTDMQANFSDEQDHRTSGPRHSRRHPNGCHPDSPSLGCDRDVVGSSLRMPSVPAPYIGPSSNKLASSKSVDAFLRSIRLDDTDPGAHEADRPRAPRVPLPPASNSVAPPKPPLHTSPKNDAQDAIGVPPSTVSHQVHLVYHGHSLSIDLSLLPDDPAGPIILLSKTESDPGAYLLIGAHYRRTGRSKAASSVIRALLDKVDHTPLQGKENVAASSDSKRPSFVTATMRPAMLMLAACELDISRESPTASERSSHASAAHDLFRAVYGSANEGIIASAERPKIRNALGLDFSSNRARSVSALDEFTPAPFVALGADFETSGQELREAQETQGSLPDTLHAIRKEQRVTGLESAAPGAEASTLVRLKEILSELCGGTPGGYV